MYNLPVDATINGNKVFHEGNHDERNNPHFQYLEKFFPNFLEVTNTSNKIFKIATINYAKNANVSLFYEINAFELNYMKEHTVRILINNDKSKNKLIHCGENNFEFFGVSNTEDNIYTLDIYVKCKMPWTFLFYRINTSINRVYTSYDNQYAFRNIKLFTNTEIDSNLKGDLNETLYIEKSLQANTATANLTTQTNTKFYLPIDGLDKKCIINLVCVDEIPSEFVYSYYINNDNKLVIVITNISAYTKALPALKWNINFKNF